MSDQDLRDAAKKHQVYLEGLGSETEASPSGKGEIISFKKAKNA